MTHFLENNKPSPASAQSFESWLQDQTLTETLAAVERQVRASPQDPDLRWLLFELLCLTGQWERALLQAQASARCRPQWTALAQLGRALIQAEHQRAQVFAGYVLPAPVTRHPAWMNALSMAIGHNTRGEHAQADALRTAAFEEAQVHGSAGGEAVGRGRVSVSVSAAASHEQPDVPQHEAPLRFAWITDSDSRLGPVCEFIASGSYRWIAFADIHEMEVRAPRGLLDRVWLPAHIRLKDPAYAQTPLQGFIPARYPLLATNPDALNGTDSASGDALLLARLTSWRDVGETGVFAQGQKTFMTDRGDLPLLEIARLSLDPAAGTPTP